MWKYVAAIFVFLGLYALLAQKVQASTVVANDTFSDGYMQSHWVLTTGNANTAEIINGALTISITQPQQITQFYLDQVLPENYHIAYEMTPHSGADKNIYTQYFDEQNWMQLHLSGDTYYFVARVNNQVILLDSGIYEWQNGTTKHVTIRNEDDYVAIHLDGQLLVSAPNMFEQLEGGYFSLLVGTGAVFPTSVSFDNVTITDLAQKEPSDEIALPVDLLKQHDPAWGRHEYDSASQWSTKNTIADWGCALTSAVMVMRYHGLTNMPNGESLNPGTVNTWLKENNGYTGGLVSFASLTVLTRQIADIYGTPKLEYQKQGPQISGITEQIAQNQPVILELPGHFVVGNGYTNTDLRILDPAFQYSVFSQHEKELLSYRTLTPSYTDLRMLEILFPSGSTGYLVDQAGNSVFGSTSFTSSITAPNGESTAITLIEVPKLAAGEYRLLVSGNATQIQLKSVTTVGEQNSVTGVLENSELLITIDADGGAAVAAPPSPTPSPPPSPSPTPTISSIPTPSLPPKPIPLPTSQSFASPSPRDVTITTSVTPSIQAPITLAPPAGTIPAITSPFFTPLPNTTATTTTSSTATPWCPNNSNQTALPTTNKFPITISFVYGWDSLSRLLLLVSSFATTVMATN